MCAPEERSERAWTPLSDSMACRFASASASSLAHPSRIGPSTFTRKSATAASAMRASDEPRSDEAERRCIADRAAPSREPDEAEHVVVGEHGVGGRVGGSPAARFN